MNVIGRIHKRYPLSSRCDQIDISSSCFFYSVLCLPSLFFFLFFYPSSFCFNLQFHFYSILFYFILFYSILFYTILFYTILFYSILFYSILFYSIFNSYILVYFFFCSFIPFPFIFYYFFFSSLSMTFVFILY